jgi:hypothetical protein
LVARVSKKLSKSDAVFIATVSPALERATAILDERRVVDARDPAPRTSSDDRRRCRVTRRGTSSLVAALNRHPFDWARASEVV